MVVGASGDRNVMVSLIPLVNFTVRQYPFHEWRIEWSPLHLSHQQPSLLHRIKNIGLSLPQPIEQSPPNPWILGVIWDL